MITQLAGFRGLSMSPFMRKLAGTFVVSLATIICLVVMTSVLAKGLGVEQFGAFCIAKRVLAAIEPWVTIAMAISIARFVALSQDRNERILYLRAGFVLISAMLTMTIAVGLLFSESISSAFFHDGVEYIELYYALLFLIAAYSYYVLLYSYYRGIGSTLAANAWQLILIGVGPMLLAFMFSTPEDLELIVWFNGVLLAVAIVPLVRLLELNTLGADTIVGLRTTVEKLIHYGVPRVAGSLLFGGMMAAGPIGAAQFGTLREAGFIVIGLSILKIFEGGIEAFGRVAMPAMAQIVDQLGKGGIRDRVADLVHLIFDLGFYLTVQSLIWSEPIVVLWLGESYSDAVLPVQILTAVLTPYLAYVTLRSVLDAIEERAVTTSYLILGCTAMVLVSGGCVAIGLSSSVCFSIGLATGLLVLSCLTTIRVCDDLQISVRKIVQYKAVAMIFGLGLISFAFKHTIYQNIDGTFEKIIVLLLCETCLFGTYLFSLKAMKVRWMHAIRSRMKLGGG